MSETTTNAVALLRNITPQLNNITDRATEAIKEAEHFLTDCGVGVPAQIQFSEDAIRGDPEVGYEIATHSLTYSRIGGSYRIGIIDEVLTSNTIERNEHDDYCQLRGAVTKHCDVKPWDQASREVRLEAVTLLPDLLQAIAKKAERISKNAEIAVKSATSILAAIRDNNTKPKPEVIIDNQLLCHFSICDLSSPCTAYIDQESGEVIWLKGDGVDVDGFAQDILELNPERYYKIFLDEESLLCARNFFESQWTSDEDLWNETGDIFARNNGIFMNFVKDAPQAAIDAFRAHQEDVVKPRVADWLEAHGFQPVL